MQFKSFYIYFNKKLRLTYWELFFNKTSKLYILYFQSVLVPNIYPSTDMHINFKNYSFGFKKINEIASLAGSYATTTPQRSRVSSRRSEARLGVENERTRHVRHENLACHRRHCRSNRSRQRRVQTLVGLPVRKLFERVAGEMYDFILNLCRLVITQS